MPPGLVVYTALFGGYHPGLKPPPAGLGADCVAFTDDPGLSAPGWDVRLVLTRGGLHPRLAAKEFKLLPHVHLASYETSIWVDAGLEIVSPDLPAAAGYMNGVNAVFFPHRHRQSVARELVAHFGLTKYRGLPLAEQVGAYQAEGFPDNLGLLECPCLVRRHNEPAIVALDDAWWAENCRWSYADQLSLPYVLWKLGTPHARFPFDLDHQPWLRWWTWRDDPEPPRDD